MSNILPLVAALKALEAQDSMPDEIVTPGTDPQYEHTSPHPLVEVCQGLANECLITDEGDINVVAMRNLQSHGYRVFCAERDSFGWRRGGITTSVGNIYFG